MWFLKVLAVLIVSIPLGILGTFFLGDLWAWVEDTHGIEAVGHASYAGWCFASTYAVIAALGLVLFARPTARA